MMKSLSAAALLLFSLMSFVDAAAQLTVYGGPQQTSAQYTIRDAKQQTDYKTGFMAGVGLKSWIEGPAYFAPQLYYSQKGYRVRFDRPNNPPDSGAVNNNTRLHTIQLAPLVQFNFSKKASYVFLRFGPAFDVALSGTEAFDSTNGKRITRAMLFDFAAYSFVTLSATAQLGFQHKSGLVVFAHYEHGLSSLNNSDYGPNIFHRILGLSVGWKLGRKK